MIQQPAGAFIDFEYHRDGKVWNAEIRCRNFRWGKYPTIWICARKLSHALDEYRNRRIPFLFIVRTEDGVRFIHIGPKNLHLLKNRWGGHTNRGDQRDIEWVVDIPIGLFENVKKV